MKISANFTKEPWLRRVHPDKATVKYIRNYKPLPGSTLDNAYVQLTAADFLNELSPAAHPINSTYMSTRPIWKPTGKKDENGKEEWVQDGFDELESVALGWQLFIAGNKIAHLSGNGGFMIANETSDTERFENLLSWMDSVGIKDAWAEACLYTEHAGDAGILLYQTNDNEIEWEVYATEKGHTIYPQEDEDGNPVYYIQYMKNGKEMCDIISTKSIEKWVKADPEEEKNLPFFERVWKRFIKDADLVKSEDGFVRINRKEAQVGSDLCQFIYYRVPDVSWGPVELSCEAHENAASYVANEVKDSAFPLLVMKAENVKSLPPSDVNGKTIAIKGSADTLAHSDVHYESPADASNIATVHFKELNDNIMRGSMSVLITPDIMKQGADSSTAIKILFRPEIEWANQRWIHYNKPTRQLVKVFKRLLGKVEGDIGKYDSLRTSLWQQVWIPQNEQEQNKIILDKVYARVISRKAAMNELGSQYKGDYEQVNKEWEEELTMKAEAPAKAKAKFGVDSNTFGSEEEVTNPADVTNQALGKSIQN